MWCVGFLQGRTSFDICMCCLSEIQVIDPECGGGGNGGRGSEGGLEDNTAL